MMTKKEILDYVGENYSAADIRGIARSLRDDGEYESIRISHPTDDLLDELESLVCKQDLVETLNDVVPGWDESEESDDDSDDDDSDGEEE